MYQVIVPEHFINMLYEIPLRHLPVLARSFISIKKIDVKEENAALHNDVSILEMLEQIRNQELE